MRTLPVRLIVAVLGALTVGIGASAFLLPLMLQLGFGFDPMTSGALTFISAFGALTSKIFGGAVLAAFGIRRVLVVNSVIAVASIAALAYIGFVPTTRAPLMATISGSAGQPNFVATVTATGDSLLVVPATC